MQAERDLAMQMRGRGDRDRFDTAIEQFVNIAYGGTTERMPDEVGLRLVRISNDGELHAGEFGQHARMVRAHDANTDNAHAQLPIPIHFRLRHTHPL